jgi:hypothetical protein
MTKYVSVMLVILSFCSALQYSLRIRALGEEFAYLIPDYETDLYKNPNLMGTKLMSVGYEKYADMPLTLRMLTKRFGLMGQYWFAHSEQVLEYGRLYTTNIRVTDSWMWDLRDKLPRWLATDVWNWYNEGNYNFVRQYLDQYHYDTTRTITYIFGSKGGYRIGKYLTIIPEVHGGLFNNYRKVIGIYVFDQWLLLWTGRLGLYYRNIKEINRFTSFYLTVGGPVSRREIDQLPYSIFSHMPFDAHEMSYFARTFVFQGGFARGFPVDNKSLLAAGVQCRFLMQRTEQFEPGMTLRALRNTISLPLALEYVVGRVQLRVGTKLRYAFQHDREYSADTVSFRICDHSLDVSFSFGLCWRLNDKLDLELYNDNSRGYYVTDWLKSWVIFFRYSPD